ncbi:TetR/AcrR family transcriptional regulator [Nocardia sp. bgisy118]|uniref:TetR/AcrR family transcriptional regulator n=1 Tax=Nocardia sp. bgisy118 TaxID=3413786 RepID=UPI003F49CBDB
MTDMRGALRLSTWPRVGRRELNKPATRQALLDAVTCLFAQRGYAATTVREIADWAGVTERTFFRCGPRPFVGKEELLVEDLLAQMPVIVESIEVRPDDEPPLMGSRARDHPADREISGPESAECPVVVSGSPPGLGLGRSVTSLMVRFERGVFDRHPEPFDSHHSGADRRRLPRCGMR